VVGFSGGPDSTALLWALSRVARSHPLPLVAAHLDHGCDEESGNRAEHARRVAGSLGVEFVCERVVPETSNLGVEAAARSERYAFLRRTRKAFGASYLAVGHHRDDQLATVVMRLLQGSGLLGLGAMRSVFGDVLRPCLEIGRAQLAAVVLEVGLPTVSDPGNSDLRRPRNKVETKILPWLRNQSEVSDEGLLAAARAARRAGDRIRQHLARELGIEASSREESSKLRLEAFRGLPAPLRPFALDALRRAAGAPYPAPQNARHELDRQLESGGAIGCDCGGGWAWRGAGVWLELARQAQREVGEFSYTLGVPGELPIPEVGLTLRIAESEPAPWMFRGSKTRAAMALPLEVGQQVLIRNRRPGDRVRPFGCSHERKLKDVLIDRRVARSERPALPLLVVDGRIAWVPGVTIDDAFRLEGQQRVWVAELTRTADSAKTQPQH